MRIPALAIIAALLVSTAVAARAQNAALSTGSPGHVLPLGIGATDFAEVAGSKIKKGDVKKAEAGKRIRFDIDGYGYLFEGGKLVLVETRASSFADFVAEATSKYGKPARLDSSTVQNGFGAQFSVGNARWELSDGSVITADETVSPSSFGYLRSTDILITTGQKRRELESIGIYKPVLP